MSNQKFETVEQYIESFPNDVQVILQTVRKAIRSAVPQAEEVIHYQIPAFNQNGWVFYYSAYKNHYSLSCPPPFTVFTEFQEELSRYELSKSVIKFPVDEPVPITLIAQMSKFRAEENEKRKSGKNG